MKFSLKGGSVILSCLLACGCAAKHTVRVDGYVPLPAVQAVHLIDCDFGVNPPRCKRIAVSYDPKKVQIEVKK
jgi:hypothetical protein